jgi:periplasmic divalent cation tolerance protein
MKAIEIHWTAASKKEARRVAQLCCQKKLAACVQIGPEIESHYIWKGKIETSKEIRVVFKTTQNRFTAIKKLILENCSYEIPEIIAFPITAGFEPYLKWIEESTTHLP